MKIYLKNNFYFLLLITVILLQSFRNATLIGYTLILMISYTLFFLHYKYKKTNMRIVNTVFLFFYILLPIISFFMMPINEFVTAFIRYVALMPIAILGLVYPIYFQENMNSILKIFCIVVVTSSLLLIYQTFFGTIEIFGEIGERLGYIRYTSLLGSTTAYGTIAPVALLIINIYSDIFSRKKGIFIQILIIIGGIICLSKSFYINILIVYGCLFLSQKHNKNVSIRKLIIFISTVFIGIFILLYIINYTPVGSYFNDMMDYTFNNQYNGVDADLMDRLTTLPKEAFNYHGVTIFSFLFGVGFKGYSGVLGLPIYPMCHNNYFDIILSQGILFFCIIMYIYIKSFILNFKTDNNQGKFISIIILYILINMLAGQWSYLTTISMIFLLLIISDLNMKNYIKNNANKKRGKG